MITQDNIIALLNTRLGIKITKSTLSRYNRRGLIVSPYYLKKRNNNQHPRRAYYPISVLEIATTALLFAGTDIATIHINPCTDEDIYLGHLLYQLKHFDFTNCTQQYYVRSIFNQSSYALTKQNVIDRIHEYETIKNGVPGAFLTTHKQHCYKIYKAIFHEVYNTLK